MTTVPTRRILPDRVLASDPAAEDVTITNSCWLEAAEDDLPCCGLGIVALAEGEIEQR